MLLNTLVHFTKLMMQFTDVSLPDIRHMQRMGNVLYTICNKITTTNVKHSIASFKLTFTIQGH